MRCRGNATEDISGHRCGSSEPATCGGGSRSERVVSEEEERNPCHLFITPDTRVLCLPTCSDHFVTYRPGECRPFPLPLEFTPSRCSFGCPALCQFWHLSRLLPGLRAQVCPPGPVRAVLCEVIQRQGRPHWAASSGLLTRPRTLTFQLGHRMSCCRE